MRTVSHVLADQAGPKAIRLADFPVQVYFSLMSAGNMSPRWEEQWGSEKTAQVNQERLFDLLGLPKAREIHMLPTHLANSRIVDTRHCGLTIKSDILLTRATEILLPLFPADCFPIVITNKEGSFIVLLHGSVWAVNKGLIRRALLRIRRTYHQFPSELYAAVGPGIRECCYISESTVGKLSPNQEWSFYLLNRSRVDLIGFINNQLARQGIPADNIVDLGLCTSCTWTQDAGHLFFSNLRSQRGGEPEGRFAVVTTRAASP